MNKNFLLFILSTALFYFTVAQDSVVEVEATDADAFQQEDENELIHAASVGDIFSVQKEIENHANLNYQNVHGWTPLIFAVENDHVNVFEMLIHAGADVNVEEADGWTALMFAGFHGDANMVEAVLNAGGDPLITNSAGFAAHTIAHNAEHYDVANTIVNAALIHAMLNDDLETCLHLIREGANVNHQNDAGWTVLALAVSMNAVQEVATLINELTANVNIPENDGWSPLMFAANNNFISMAEMLLAAGANVSYKNDKGVGAIDLAKTEKFSEMVELLTPAE